MLNRTDDASIEALIARMKAEGREKEIQKELKKLKNLKQTNIPKACLLYTSLELPHGLLLLLSGSGGPGSAIF